MVVRKIEQTGHRRSLNVRRRNITSRAIDSRGRIVGRGAMREHSAFIGARDATGRRLASLLARLDSADLTDAQRRRVATARDDARLFPHRHASILASLRYLEGN